MSYSHSKYHLNNKSCFESNRPCHVRPTLHLLKQSDNISSFQSSHNSANDISSKYIRAPNIHINPNLSGSVYINKNKFNINQNLQSVSSVDPRLNTSSDCKIHYNPKFFRSAQQSVHSLNLNNPNDTSITKTIYINPSFTKNVNLNKKLEVGPSVSSNYNAKCVLTEPNCIFSLDSLNKHSTNFAQQNNSGNKTECIYINPNFVKTFNYQQSIQTYSESPDQSFNYNLPNPNCDQSLTEPFEQSECSQVVPSFISKYRKVNHVSPFNPKPSSKISKYKLQRNNISKNNLMSHHTSSSKIVSPKHIKFPVRKPRLSGSFKKIGKRKLVRKSLIQNYIESRRQSLPSMMQHSRNTLASRKKLVSKTKYKLVRQEYTSSFKKKSPLLKLTNYKKERTIPSKAKLKWKRADNIRSRDFLKISKSKIIRKSILQSIIEARRSSLYNFRKYSPNKKISLMKDKVNLKSVKSQFKVIRNIALAQSSQHQHSSISLDYRKRSTSFSTNKKIGSGSFNNALKSKSILYRMPPSLRFKIKLEEKRKKNNLLTKINNRKKCLFYNRFGYCKGYEEGTCKKVHDPQSVAVCRKFLKGLCDGEGCKLSHNVVPEKMPTCHQFLAGVCIRPSCPFLHVKLSCDQPICIDFLQGYCHQGDSCTKRHQFICPEWAKEGSCKSDKCSYPHPLTSTKKIHATKSLTSKVSQKEEKIKENCEHNIFKNTNEEIKNRYFSNSGEHNESNDKIKNENAEVVERKPEIKDGVNSVYKDESLLSFIPFS